MPILCYIRYADGITYMPVHEDSFLFKAAAAWQFPAFVICLGSSYLQRMMARLPQLAEAMLACPGFEDYSQDFKTQQVGCSAVYCAYQRSAYGIGPCLTVSLRQLNFAGVLSSFLHPTVLQEVLQTVLLPCACRTTHLPPLNLPSFTAKQLSPPLPHCAPSS